MSHPQPPGWNPPPPPPPGPVSPPAWGAPQPHAPAPSRTGRKVAFGCLFAVVAVFVILLVVGLFAVLAGRSGTEPGTPAAAPTAPAATTRSVFDLQEGDCYETRTVAPQPGQTVPISTVDVVDCSTPHTRQVVAKISYSAADPFAGARARAETDCAAKFTSVLSAADRRDTTLQAGFIVPADEGSWARNPVAACTVISTAPISRSVLR